MHPTEPVADVYIEAGVGAHVDEATVAWTFDCDHWGLCGQGMDDETALASLARALGRDEGKLRVRERIEGDEQAFGRDFQPVSTDERQRTVQILVAARRETVRLVSALPEGLLDWDDPERVLPNWARWRTLRGMAWHLADTESRYYLPSLGIAGRPAAPELLEELRFSHAYVVRAVQTMEPDLVRRANDEVWTTAKLFRRLAWHERSELMTMRQMAEKARTALRP